MRWVTLKYIILEPKLLSEKSICLNSRVILSFHSEKNKKKKKRMKIFILFASRN